MAELECIRDQSQGKTGMKISPFQLEALRAAQNCGSLRYLPGGYWVRGDYPEVSRGHSPKVWLETKTIKACVARGWLMMPAYHTANITDEGRTIVANNAEVDTSKDVMPYNRLSAA